MAETPAPLSEELRILESKINQLKLDYEQYFLGSRPREPAMQRAEIQKAMVRLSNSAIKNTADRFKFNSLNSRFMTFKRQWDDTQRKIEAGTYKRHVFKANLRERSREEILQSSGGAGKPAANGNAAGGEGDIFANYLEAAKSCGQNVDALTPQKLQAAIAKQEAAIKKKLGVEKVKFRVEVEGGKVKLKATAVRAA